MSLRFYQVKLGDRPAYMGDIDNTSGQAPNIAATPKEQKQK